MNRLIVIAAVASLAVCGVLIALLQNSYADAKQQKLAAALELTQLKLQGKQAQLSQVAQAANALADLHARNDQLQAAARNTINGLQSQSNQRRLTIERLERENATLKIWGDAPLPADLVRLQQHPAFDSAASYREWLSQSEPLPTSQQPTTDQSGATERP